MKGCKVEGCTGNHEAHGYCKKHYMQLWRYGELREDTPEQCKVEGCSEVRFAKGYCERHYKQMWKYGVITERVPPPTHCKVDGCNNVHRAKGYCNKHWQQVSRHGRILDRTVRDRNEFVFDKDICRIKLYNDKNKEVAEAIIDSEDYEKCKDLKWYLTNSGYVLSGHSPYLQHLVFGRKTQLDHIDGDKLNNRKNNLRTCTTAENSRNCKISKNNTSGYKGVSWNKERNKWTADIMYNYKHIYLGEFIEGKQAAAAYNEKAAELHGEFAQLNII